MPTYTMKLRGQRKQIQCNDPEENSDGYSGSTDDIMMTEGDDSTGHRPLKIPSHPKTATPRQSSGLKINDNAVGGGESDENIHLNTFNATPLSSSAVFTDDTDASFKNEDGRGADMDSKCGAQFLGNGTLTGNSNSEDPPLSEYELLRLRKIKRNEARLAQLGLLVPDAAATAKSSSSLGTSALTTLLTEPSNSNSTEKKRKKRDTNTVPVTRRVLPDRRCKGNAAARPTLFIPSSLPLPIDYSFSSTGKASMPMPIGHTVVSDEEFAFLEEHTDPPPPPLSNGSTAVVESCPRAPVVLAFAPPSIGHDTDVSDEEFAFLEEHTAPLLSNASTAVVASCPPAPVAVADAAAADAAPPAKRRKPRTHHMPDTVKGKSMTEAVVAVKNGDPRVEGLSLAKVAEIFGVCHVSLTRRVPAEYKNPPGHKPASSDHTIANAQSIYQRMIKHVTGSSFLIPGACNAAEKKLLPDKCQGLNIYRLTKKTMLRYVNKDEKFFVETGKFKVPKELRGKVQLVKVTENGHLSTGKRVRRPTPKKSKVPQQLDPRDKEKIEAAIGAVRRSGAKQKKSPNDKSGLPRGVTMRPSGKWQAQIVYAGKSRYIGVFDSREKACLAYEISREVLKTDKGEDPKTSEIDANINLARKAAFAGVGQN